MSGSSSEQSTSPSDAPRMLDLYPSEVSGHIQLYMDEGVRGEDVLFTLACLTPSHEEMERQVEVIIEEQIVNPGLLRGTVLNIPDTPVSDRLTVERTIQLPSDVTMEDLRQVARLIDKDSVAKGLRRLLTGLVDSGRFRNLWLTVPERGLSAASTEDLGKAAQALAKGLGGSEAGPSTR